VRREASWSAAVRPSASSAAAFAAPLDAAKVQSAEIHLCLPEDYVSTTRDVMETVQDTLQKIYGFNGSTLQRIRAVMRFCPGKL
jgi:glycine cleavage system protein P-like pyridoxal-binding family